MLQIGLTLDVANYDRDVDLAIREAVLLQVAGFLNRLAEAARDAVQEAMRSGLDRPAPFTLQGVKVIPARASGSGMDAIVFIADLQAGYLDLLVTPGVRTAGDPGTTRLSPLVPGPAAPRDRFGNLPRGYIAEVMRQPNVA
jgi:hypothetical protein